MGTLRQLVDGIVKTPQRSRAGRFCSWRPPAHRWRTGAPVCGARVPKKAPARAADFEQLATDLRLAFDLAPAEARLSAPLMVRNDAPRAALQSAIRGPGGVNIRVPLVTAPTRYAANSPGTATSAAGAESIIAARQFDRIHRSDGALYG